MPKEIQNPNTAYGLTDATGIKGRFPMQIDEVGVATWNVLDLEQSPYDREATPCAGHRNQAAAGAGVYSLVGVQPSPGLILEVRQVIVVNTSGATIRASLYWIDGTSFALWAIVSSVNMVDLSALDPGVAPAVPWNPTVGSQVHALTRNAAGPANGRICIFTVLNGQHTTLTFPYGIHLNGRSALGAPALLVEPYTAVNTGIEATFLGREFKPKG